MVNQVHNLKLFLRKRIACCIQDTHTPSTHHGQACAQVKHLELRRRHPETAGEKFWIKKASQNCRRNIMSLKKPHTAGETSWWRNPQTAGQINSVGQYPRAISHATAPSFSQCPQWPEWRRRTCRTVPPAELHQDKACPGIPLWENRIFIPNNQNPGQNPSASKTVPELATHWHSRGPQSKLHASSAVLGWGLATTGGIGMAPSHLQYEKPPDVRWHLLTCNIFHLQIWHGTFQGCQMHRKTKMIKPKFKSKLKSSKQPWNPLRPKPKYHIPSKTSKFCWKTTKWCENHQKQIRNALQPNCTTINAIIVTNTTKYGSVHRSGTLHHKRPQKATTDTMPPRDD